MQGISDPGSGNTSANGTAGGGLSVNIDPIASALQAFIAHTTGITGTAGDLVTSALILAFFIVLSQIVHDFVLKVAPRLVSRTGSVLDDEILKAVKGPIRLLIVLIGAYLTFKSLDNLSPGLVETLDSLATASLIMVAAYFVGNLIAAFMAWYGKEVAPNTETDLDDHLLPFMSRVIIAAVYILALLLVLARFGIQITALVASMGVAGIAVALAAQEALSNVFGAIAIMTDRPYKPGDRLLISGIGQGDVVDVGLRSTRVLTRNRQLVIIPNRDMAGNEIVNLSQPDSRFRLRLTAGVAYGTDLEKACRTMEEIASANALVAPEPQVRAYVDQLGDFAVQISLYAWVKDYNDDLAATDQIYREVLTRFRQEGIDITYPVMTVIPKSP